MVRQKPKENPNEIGVSATITSLQPARRPTERPEANPNGLGRRVREIDSSYGHRPQRRQEPSFRLFIDPPRYVELIAYTNVCTLTSAVRQSANHFV